jgi:hypothetical protein
VPKRIAIWNPTRGIWEDPHGATDLLSEHSEPFSETWPTSGTTRNGAAYELPTQAPPTDDSGSSSLPTPRAMDSVGGIYPLDRPQNMDNLETRMARLLKTPTSQLAVNGGSQHPDKRRKGGHGPTLADEVEHLLPTPNASLSNYDEDPEQWETRRQQVKARGINGNGMGIPLGIAVQLLPSRQED